MGRMQFTATITMTCLLAPAPSSADDLVVYDNVLATGWQNWSWSTTVNFANASPALGGGGASIAVTHTSAWAGLYLATFNALSAADFGSVRFSIHGGAGGGQQLMLSLYDASHTASASFSLAPAPANQWQQVEVPLSAFGLPTIGGIVCQDATGGAQPTYYLDAISFVAAGPQPPGPGPALTVDTSADQHPISPYIYAINFGDPALVAELKLPVRRWGGNATTRYNWQNDTSNRAFDYFFENIPNPNDDPQALPDGSSSDDFVEENLASGTDTIMTVPLIGWTPKLRQFDCGFRVSLYGPQQATDPYQPDCGNGVTPGGANIIGNNPLDTSLAIGPPFVQSWVTHLVNRYGPASQGGVRFYALDNEPMLWNSTHRDVHPEPTSYDEMRDRTYAYAPAIKAADPSARTLGPAEWGWTGYFYSALDAAPGGAWWLNPLDQLAHGGVPFVAWYLQQVQTYEIANGQRILDYLDLHYYPQAPGVALSGAGSGATQALRLRSTRSLWDPTYVDESWIAQPVRLIPRMHEWVDQNYPGTLVAVNEYNWGALDHINGALTQADVLGIFGCEHVDLASIWDPPESTQPGAFAFRVFRSYNGSGARFGNTGVQASSADQGKVSAYAALRFGSVLTIVLINKTTGPLDSPLTLTGWSPSGPAKVFRYSAANLAAIVQQPSLTLGAPTMLSLPANSITLLAVPGPLLPADLDQDGDVDLADAQALVTCLITPGCLAADITGDGVTNLVDFAALQRLFTGD